MTNDEAIANINMIRVAFVDPVTKEQRKLIDDTLDTAIKALEQTTWIPVSERLPEEKIAVLVWCPERKNIYCACLEENQWWIFGAYFQKVELEVVAWMSLPLPWKGE